MGHSATSGPASRQVVEVIDEPAEAAVAAAVDDEDEPPEGGELGLVAFDRQGPGDAEGAAGDKSAPSRGGIGPIPVVVFVQEAALPGIQIGQLLVEQGVLTEQQVRHILQVQKMSHRPFGDLAERLFGINPKAVEDAWVEQYLRVAGVVDLDEQEIETECLRLLNRRQAWQFHLLPLHRDEDQAVNMATSPENLVRSVNFATRKLDEPVHFLIAERKQLREFLMKHYPVPQFIAQYAEKM